MMLSQVALQFAKHCMEPRDDYYVEKTTHSIRSGAIGEIKGFNQNLDYFSLEDILGKVKLYCEKNNIHISFGTDPKGWWAQIDLWAKESHVSNCLATAAMSACIHHSKEEKK